MAQKEKHMARNMSGDELKARRSACKALIAEILEENPGTALHLGGWVKKWEAKTGLEHNAIQWYDVEHALKDLVKEGKLTVDDSGKRTAYTTPAKVDTGIQELPLEFKD